MESDALDAALEQFTVVFVMVEVIGFLAEYSSAWLLVLLGCTATAYILKLSFAIELHPDEPPLLAPKIPLIGHILGMFWYQNDYFKVLECVL